MIYLILAALFCLVLVSVIPVAKNVNRRTKELYAETPEGGIRRDFLEFFFGGVAIEIDKTGEKPKTRLQFVTREN